MDAIEFLAEQHLEIESLFARLEGAGDAERQSLVTQVAFAIKRHSAIEQEHLYPLVGEISMDEVVERSLNAHEVMKASIADLEVTAVEEDSFHAKLTALREEVTQHLQEEEQSLFPLLKSALSEAKRQSIGRAMVHSSDAFDELEANVPLAMEFPLQG